MIERFSCNSDNVGKMKPLNRLEVLEELNSFLGFNREESTVLYKVLGKTETATLDFALGDMEISIFRDNILPAADDEGTVEISITRKKDKRGRTESYEYSMKAIKSLGRLKQ